MGVLLVGSRLGTLCLAAVAAVAAVAGGCGRGTARPEAASRATRAYRPSVPVVWPPLPDTGFIRGRVATAADVTAGDAVFAACVGVSGRPLQVAIPQYALWHDPATDSVTPVIVVEAELFGGDSMFGLRRIPGGTSEMATAAHLELLGRTPPGPAAGHLAAPNGSPPGAAVTFPPTPRTTDPYRGNRPHG